MCRIITFCISLCIITFLTINGYAQMKVEHGPYYVEPGGPEVGISETVEVIANKETLKLIENWDKKIWFYTSKNNPIKSLEGLDWGSVACWGAELMDYFIDFLNKAGISTTKIAHVVGVGNPLFTEQWQTEFPESKPIKLFFTWSRFNEIAVTEGGAIRVKFIEDSGSRE